MKITKRQAAHLRVTFWKTMTMKEADVFAKSAGTNGAYLRQIAYGHKRPSPELAFILEEKSRGAWSKEILLPEYFK